jgi:hypothetical protein
MSKQKQTKLKHYVVTYSITKCELVYDLFTTSKRREIAKQIKELVERYNEHDEASQIVDAQIISIEESTHGKE